jgi:hypothetical protein
MIFRVQKTEQTEFATAKNLEHLNQSYVEELGQDEFDSIDSVEEVTAEESKSIEVKSDEDGMVYSLFDLCDGLEEFGIVAYDEY